MRTEPLPKELSDLINKADDEMTAIMVKLVDDLNKMKRSKPEVLDGHILAALTHLEVGNLMGVFHMGTHYVPDDAIKAAFDNFFRLVKGDAWELIEQARADKDEETKQ